MPIHFHRLTRFALVPIMALAMGNAMADDDDMPILYSGDFTELATLDNGVVLEGAELAMPDGATSGFRLLAGYLLPKLPRLGIGAEITYLVTDETPTSIANESVLLNTTSLQGAVTAGLYLGRFSLFAKSGLADWSGDLETTLASSDAQEVDMAMGGTAQIHGFGARFNVTPRTVAHLQYERIDAPRLEHLNLTTAKIAYRF